MVRLGTDLLPIVWRFGGAGSGTSPLTFKQSISDNANRQLSIGNQKCFWRRGWDSNPRNGFPLTAFPVLPIQPLLHLSSIANFRLPIANWSLRGIDLLWQKTNRQSAIKNRQCRGGEGGIRTHGGR